MSHVRLERLSPRAAPPGADPGWVRELAVLLEEAERAGDESLQAWNGSPAEAALSPLLAAADAALEAELAHRGAAVLPSARRDLVALLSRRLVSACLHVLALERQALDTAARMLGKPPLALDPSPTEWLSRFERHPVLAWLLGRILQGWRTHVRELTSRLEADGPLLTASLWGGRAPGALAGVLGDAGDMHDGGRSVAVLRFEDGRRAVYKPKDLRITRAVLDLCAFLNASGLPLPLHVRAVLPREGYTWEEFAPVEPCRTPAEVERFYLRMGMLVRLMQLLEATDLWLDNLVAAGEHPVLIDLEMVLQPRRPAPSGPPAEREAEAWLSESVAPLGLLSAPTPIAPGLAAEDLGALAPARAFLTPYRSAPRLEALAGGILPSRDGFRLRSHQDHAPTLGGEPVRAVDHLEPLLEGYRAMHAALHRNREGLLEAGGPLARMARLPVRYIHRTTWTCYRLLLMGLAPPLLTEQNRREEALASPLRTTGDGPEAEAERRVARAELEALRELNIPYFVCRADSDELLDPKGRVIGAGFFRGSALERARQRLRELDTFDLARHEAMVCSTLACGHRAPKPGGRLGKAEAAGAASPDWLAEAVAVGEFVLGEAFRAGGGFSWVGLRYEPLHGLWHPAVLPPDLLTGTAGIALVLAELHAASGHARFREAALGALEATRAAVAKRADWEAEPLEVGAFRGVGAHLYALHRCAIALDEPELDELARAFAASLPLEHIAARASLDLVTGAPGLLLALTACGLMPAARALAAALAPRLSGGPPAPPSTPVPLQCLPDAASGWALCAARLREAGQAPSWPPHPLEPPASTGALLARLALGEEPGLQARLIRHLEDAPDSATARLEGLELALVAAGTGEPGWREHAERLGRGMVAEHRARGHWFPDRLSADAHEPSALWGLCAVAHAFLRLHQPGRWPSLRLIGL
jgi:type 2 lantibiotic biosynthesis protein LanM